MFFRKKIKNKLINNLEWKDKNKEYLKEIQLFLDKAEKIENKEIKHEIITQMLKCDSILTQLCERKIKEIYKNCNIK